jgi:hypothetical protein
LVELTLIYTDADGREFWIESPGRERRVQLLMREPDGTQRELDSLYLDQDDSGELRARWTLVNAR